MTEELNLNWRLKKLTVITGTLWQSKVLGDILGLVPSEFSNIVSYFVKWVFEAVLGCQEATVFKALCDRPTGSFLSHRVLA